MTKKSIIRLPVYLSSMILICFQACGDKIGSQKLSESKDSINAEPTVLVVYPKQGDVKQSITLPGSIMPYESSALYAKATGFIKKINADIGDVVKKGDELALLILPEVTAEIQRAEADLVKAKANEELAAITHKRLAQLWDSEPGAVTQQDVDLAEAKLKVARAEIKVSEASLSRLEVLKSYAIIRAPFDGTVTKRNLDTGALVSAGNSKSQPIFEIASTNKLCIVIYLPEFMAPFINRGHKIRFMVDSYPGKTFNNYLARVAGALSSDTRTMRAEIDIENQDAHFLPGMYAKVVLEFKDIPDALTIPATSLLIKKDETSVIIVKDGKLQKVAVNILMDDGVDVVVTGEISKDTPVVYSGPALLEEGQNVQIRSEGVTK